MKYYLAFWVFFLGAAIANAQLTPQQWIADLAVIKRILPEQDPFLFDRITKKEFDQSFEQLASQLPGLNNFQTALSVQAILAQVKDANTYADMKTVMMAENPIPFALGYYADGVFVSGTVKRFEKAMGKKVLQVNGMDMKAVVQLLSKYVPIENEYAVYKDGFNYLRFPVAFKMAGISKNDTLVLTVENSQKQTEQVKLFPINLRNSKDMMPLQTQQEKRDLRWQPLQNYYTNHWLPEDSTLYIMYNRCVSSEMALAVGDSLTSTQLPPFQPFADSLLAFMQRSPGAKLLFDLRFNMGGNAADGLQLIERIKAMPQLNKKGKLFVATNLYTTGAAIQIAAEFSKETKAQIIGEIPAGRPNQYTGLRSFSLPNSKIQVYFPSKSVKTLKHDPDTLKMDTLIPLSYEDFRTGKDPVLDYVRKQR
jgi:hypothetical protein